MHFSILVTNDRKMWAHIALIAAVKLIVLLQSSVYVLLLCRHGGTATQPPAERLIPVRFRVSA
jgi:hypothetical protein